MDGKEWIEKGKKKLLSLGVKQWGMLLLAGICCLVMITANRTVQKNVLQDGSRERGQVTETDSNGGSRNSVSEKSEGTTVFYDIEGDSTPYILSETYPEITGVLVIAEGSGTGTVDLDILNAVQVLFDVPAHKIKIMKMK